MTGWREGYPAGDIGARASIVPGALLLGVGLGGFVDGIVLHQILQWHHMLTDYAGYASFPATTVQELQDNTLADGLFHAATWLFVAVGVLLLGRATVRGARWTWRTCVGMALVGSGSFNLVEGVVDHHVLSIHHVRDDVIDPLLWDLGFLALGALLVAVGFLLRRRDARGQAVSAATQHRLTTGRSPRTGPEAPRSRAEEVPVLHDRRVEDVAIDHAVRHLHVHMLPEGFFAGGPAGNDLLEDAG